MAPAGADSAGSVGEAAAVVVTFLSSRVRLAVPRVQSPVMRVQSPVILSPSTRALTVPSFAAAPSFNESLEAASVPSEMSIAVSPFIRRPVILPPSFLSSSDTFSSAAPAVFAVPSYFPDTVSWARANDAPSTNVRTNKPAVRLKLRLKLWIVWFTGSFPFKKLLRRLVTLLAFERVLRLLGDARERFRLMHGEIGKDLSVEFDIGQFQTMHEL